ncbi:MAG: hypothetical protein JW838_08930 [Spirochaetes bacterium]|nr:hypothetical protein [Spirochaetota bacterium]
MNFWKVSTIALAVALALSFGFIANSAQPHMRSALQALQSAKAHLNKASHDKGGHRVKALSLVNDAISEVRKGIAAGAD